MEELLGIPTRQVDIRLPESEVLRQMWSCPSDLAKSSQTLVFGCRMIHGLLGGMQVRRNPRLAIRMRLKVAAAGW